MRISVESVCVAFRRGSQVFPVLEDFSLVVGDGEFLALAGRSGSGKSTALAVAFGMLAPDSGHVVWEGERLGDLSERRRQVIRRERIGYASQDVLAFEDLTAAANVVLGGCSRDRALELLGELGLEEVAGTRVGRLSGGERQRVTVARTLAKGPGLVVMDEPTSSLDSEAAGRVIGLLRQAADSGAAVLVATHDDMVCAAADRVMEL